IMRSFVGPPKISRRVIVLSISHRLYGGRECPNQARRRKARLRPSWQGWSAILADQRHLAVDGSNNVADHQPASSSIRPISTRTAEISAGVSEYAAGVASATA